MSVRVIPWKPDRLKNRWLVDIRFRKTDGTKVRDRQIHEAPTKAQARKWGEAREAQLRAGTLVIGNERTDVPTLAEFYPRFIEHSANTGRKGRPDSPSWVLSKEIAYRVHLGPAFGSLPLDEISDERVSKLRSKSLKGRAQKTVNNVLSPLNSCLKLAVAWKVIASMPCTIHIPPVSDTKPNFYDFDEYERLCEGAVKAGTREDALVRLGGDAGLRRGELMALRWVDVNFKRRQICVEQAAWKHSRKQAKASGAAEWTIKKPKGGKGRFVPMTDALCEALQAHRHIRGEYVLSQEDGSIVPGHMLRDWLEAAQRRAVMTTLGALHKLRHTFCSHLAMRGAPAKAIQELAGHTDLKQTMRYMHLSPSALDQAIALLNPAKSGATGGATLGAAR
jgi:integrase